MLSLWYLRERLSRQSLWRYLTLYTECRVLHVINTDIHRMISLSMDIYTVILFFFLHCFTQCDNNCLSPASLHTEVCLWDKSPEMGWLWSEVCAFKILVGCTETNSWGDPLFLQLNLVCRSLWSHTSPPSEGEPRPSPILAPHHCPLGLPSGQCICILPFCLVLSRMPR